MITIRVILSANVGKKRNLKKEHVSTRVIPTIRMRGVPPAKDTQQKHVESLYRSISCPCIVASIPLARCEAENEHLPRTRSAIFHSKQSHYPYNQTHNHQHSPNLQSFFTPVSDVFSTYDAKSSEAMKQISAVCGCCGCSCGPCGLRCGGCCSLPPPCNTPAKCLQCMTGYYYYPYGNWFCGPYHVKGTCSGGPVSPGGPCGPNPPNPDGPCGPCGSCCCCFPVDMSMGKAVGTCFAGLGPIASCNCAAPSSAKQDMGMYYIQGMQQSNRVVCPCDPSDPSRDTVATRHMNNPKNLDLRSNQNPPREHNPQQISPTELQTATTYHPPTNNNSPSNQNRPMIVPSSGNARCVRLASSSNPWAYCGGRMPLSPPCRSSRYFKSSPFCCCRSCSGRCKASCGPFGPYGPCGPCGISCGACGPCRTICGPCGCSSGPCGFGNCGYCGGSPCSCGPFGCYGCGPYGCYGSGPCGSCGYNHGCGPSGCGQFSYGSCGCSSSGCGPCGCIPWGCGGCGCKPWCGPFYNCCLTPTPTSLSTDGQFNVCNPNVISFPSLSCFSSMPPLCNLPCSTLFVPTRGFSSDHHCVPSNSVTPLQKSTPNISKAASNLSASITLSGGESYYPSNINPKFVKTFPFERKQTHHQRTSSSFNSTLIRNYSSDIKATSFRDGEDNKIVKVLLCTYSSDCRAMTAPKDMKKSTKNETVQRKCFHDWSLYSHSKPKSVIK